MTRPILLLDVMETLVSEPFFEEVPRFFGLSLEALLAAKDPMSWIEFEHGRIDEATYAATFFRDRRPVDLDAIKAFMRDAYAWLDGVEPLLAELQARGVPMYGLSNYSSWYRLIDEKLGLSRYVDLRFVSCNTGVRKPDPEAYLGAARALGVPPSACVFVDDRRKNVEAAVAVGMRGLLREKDIASLRHGLEDLGVL